MNVVSTDLETSKIKRLLYIGSNIVPANINKNMQTMAVVYPSISLLNSDKKKTSKNEMFFDVDISESSNSLYKQSNNKPVYVGEEESSKEETKNNESHY